MQSTGPQRQYTFERSYQAVDPSSNFVIIRNQLLTRANMNAEREGLYKRIYILIRKHVSITFSEER